MTMFLLAATHCRRHSKPLRVDTCLHVCQLHRFENTRMAEISDQLSKLDLQYFLTPSPTTSYKKNNILSITYFLLAKFKS